MRTAIGDRAGDQKHGPDHDEGENLFRPEHGKRKNVASDYVDDVDADGDEKQNAGDDMRHFDKNQLFNPFLLGGHLCFRHDAVLGFLGSRLSQRRGVRMVGD
jgi:hypothetical protein